MRSIETLVRTYPSLTGMAILELQEKDKAADEREYQKRNKKILDMVENINIHGGFYKGSFGSNQYFVYNFTNLTINDGEVYCDVENIVVFLERDSRYPFKVEVSSDTFCNLDKYGITSYERITNEEYNEVRDYYANSVPKFWKVIDLNK